MASFYRSCNSFFFIQITMIKQLFFLIFLISFSLLACDNGTPETNEPENLTVNIDISNVNEGIVDITATAENAVEYKVLINEDENSALTNSSGVFQLDFDEEGFFDIEVRAYGNSGKFIKKDSQVEITLGNEINPEDGYTTPLSYPDYTLVWNDEFNGTSINTSDWNFETGTGDGGWGNNELQYYRSSNAWVEDGLLVIHADDDGYQDSDYTSTRMTTQNNRYFQYGRIDIKALLPEGKGIWPALWMLGQNFSSVGWPACGEIDIMEMVGGSGRENTVHGTLHWENSGHVQTGGSYETLGNNFAEQYHVFTLLWDETSIKWLVDDVQYHVIDIQPAHMTEFHNPFFFIFNVAVGGNWPGSPDETTVFPQRMKVDYVRVFQTTK